MAANPADRISANAQEPFSRLLHHVSNFCCMERMNMYRSRPRGNRFFVVVVILVLGFVASACASTSDQSTATEEPQAATEPEGDADDEPETGESTDPTDEDQADTSDAPAGDSDQPVSDIAVEPVDLEAFFSGAIVGDVATEACTLSGGTETECYRFTVTGHPVSYETGPFCPTTDSATADEVGLWLDGENLYDIDGEFVGSLAELYEDDFWQLVNADGTVNVTETAEEFELAAVPEVDESLLNHCVEGRVEWLPNGEPITSEVTIPVTPVVAAATIGGGNWGVTLDGVVIAQSAPVDAILGNYTIAAFDDCGGHYNPFEGYHIHAATGCSELEASVEGETATFGIAMDGFPIHSPLGDEFEGELDECGGHFTEGIGYHYHANPPEENTVLTCLIGETVAGAGSGRRGGGPPPGE